MGCLNDEGKFEHWFGNIHLSGPCNRSCYFCIGQHMMALDSCNNLKDWPLANLTKFLEECKTRNVKEVCVTGTNTDPMLYHHTGKLLQAVSAALPDTPIALRTNAVAYHPSVFDCYDKASITICSLNPNTYKLMMGGTKIPDVESILNNHPMMDIKINVVLGPENVETHDIFRTLDRLAEMGVKRVNIREPYGQPHIGDPMPSAAAERIGTILGMPQYLWADKLSVLYWDVHYVEVESVNLYASGNISLTYPITKGYDPSGEVHEQSHWPKSGRQQEQWLNQKLVRIQHD